MDYIIDNIKEAIYCDDFKNVILKAITIEGEEILIKMSMEQALRILERENKCIDK